MKIETKFFGEIAIQEENILQFEEGLPGFEDLRQFALLEVFEMEDFVALQSLERKETAFVMMRPWNAFPDYQLQISDEELKEIGIESPEQVALFNIVSIPGEFKDATANLLAPVVVNIDKRTGKQYVLREDVFTTRHRIFPEERV